MIRDIRARGVLISIVDIYLETRVPVASRTVAKTMSYSLSPATLRNVMADLEDDGFLCSPHRSAGRVPTGKALEFYICEQKKDLPLCRRIEEILQKQICQSGDWSDALADLSSVLAALSECVAIAFIPAYEPIIHSIDFLPMGPQKILAVLVADCGRVEHRLIHCEENISPNSLKEASNYLNARISGYSLKEGKKNLYQALHHQQAHLHALALSLMERGIQEKISAASQTIVKGQNHLLEGVDDLEDLQTFKALSSWLEQQQTFQDLFEKVWQAGCIQIFLGTESPLFDVGGCSFIIAPYRQMRGAMRGGIGVIGPNHMDYRRIIPMIEGTVEFIERTF